MSPFCKPVPRQLRLRDALDTAERTEHEPPPRKGFWEILEDIAAAEGMSVPRFISTLHQEILLLRGEVPNFTSHLRCICVTARTSAEPGGESARGGRLKPLGGVVSR